MSLAFLYLNKSCLHSCEFSCQFIWIHFILIDFLKSIFQHCSQILVSLVSLIVSFTVRFIISACSLRVKYLKDFQLQVSISMRLVDNFALDRSFEYFRMVIVDVLFQVLHVLSRLTLEILIPEHVADLLQMIWRSQSNKSRSTIILIFIVHVSIVHVLSCYSSATCLLCQVRKVLRDYKCQVLDTCPKVKFSGVIFSALDTLCFAKLRTQDLNENLILFKECSLKLEHRSNALRDGVNTTILISQNEIIVSVGRFDESNVLNVIFQTWYRFDYECNWEYVSNSKHCKSV